MRSYYMCFDKCLEVFDVDISRETVVRRTVEFNALWSPFQSCEPSFRDFEQYLESRCFPRYRANRKEIFKAIGIDYYDPWSLVHRTRGIMMDRHFYNIIFLVDPDGTLRRAPLFDNGAGLLSDQMMDYGMSLPLLTCINKVKAKPFSTDFRKQVCYLNSICGDPFEGISSVTIHTSDLYDYYPADHVSRALAALRHGLEKRGIGLSVGKKEIIG
ncbi:MAG: hypothetical protein E7478_01715 [Ruminococcaceae bacterium]|nr:hypothetical protein [Oscillospiraceae bacterium]